MRALPCRFRNSKFLSIIALSQMDGLLLLVAALMRMGDPQSFLGWVKDHRQSSYLYYHWLPDTNIVHLKFLFSSKLYNRAAAELEVHCPKDLFPLEKQQILESFLPIRIFQLKHDHLISIYVSDAHFE
jgi:hypothetical protein